MNITDIKIYPVQHAEPLLAFVRVILDDSFLVRDIKVIQGKKSVFVAMPSRKSSRGGFRDIVHPINQSTRKRFESQIIEAYEKHIANGSALTTDDLDPPL